MNTVIERPEGQVRPVALEPATLRPPGASLPCDAHPLHAVQIQLAACVGQLDTTIGRLLQARENELIALDRRIDAPVDLLLNGRLVARGELVAVDGCLGVRLTELPQPLEL